MTRGICILSVGHKCFEKYSYNLACSIRYKDKEIPICLLTDKSYSSSIFTSIIQIPKEYLYYNEVLNICRLKLLINKLSPFDNTIYVDASSLWISDRKISNIFDDISIHGLNFLIQNNKFIKLSDEKIICRYAIGIHVIDDFDPRIEYKNDIMYECQGQFMMFNKSEEANLFFNTCTSLYEKITNGDIKFKKNWKVHDYITDEMCTTIVSGMLPVNFGTFGNGFSPVSCQNDCLDVIDPKSNRIFFIKINGMNTNEDVRKEGSSYCLGEEKTLKYINHYNNKIREINNNTDYNCLYYPDKHYIFK